ncbi:hypothetical protein B9Z65_471 [Elsinoe australis]|uniref:Uncharacterized protein n=1 Tax=Elsinoe australis TaxID=40998 RepID=A0A2P8AIP6_9PEZI|nr:hypothetical protein B9Z65_471 [Elsinoe australis]
MSSPAAYCAPIDFPQVQDCKHRIRSQLDVIPEPVVRGVLKEATTTTIRITLRLLPRDGTFASQIKHIDDGTARQLLLILRAAVNSLLTNAQASVGCTEGPLEAAQMMREQRSKGLKVILGDWRDIIHGLSLPSGGVTKTIRAVAELFDVAVYYPAISVYESSPNHHPIHQFFDLITEISLNINEAARLSRFSDINIRAIFNAMSESTTPRDRTLIFQNSPNIISSNAELAYPSPLETGRSMSFSGSVLVPDPIEEPRCSLYRDSVHECEAEGCKMDVKTVLRSDDDASGPQSLPETIPDTFNGDEVDESDGLLMMATSPPRDLPDVQTDLQKAVRHERMKSLQLLSGESPLELKHRRLQRVYSLPLGSLLGSVPARKRRVTADALTPMEKQIDATKHTPSKSLPTPTTGQTPALPQRGNTA